MLKNIMFAYLSAGPASSANVVMSADFGAKKCLLSWSGNKNQLDQKSRNKFIYARTRRSDPKKCCKKSADPDSGGDGSEDQKSRETNFARGYEKAPEKIWRSHETLYRAANKILAGGVCQNSYAGG